jgi:hypothetical protein
MSVAMTFGGALIQGPRNATTTISVQSRGFRLQIDRSASFVNSDVVRAFAVGVAVAVVVALH